MKSLVNYIKESHSNEDILKKEFKQSKFPESYKDEGKEIDESKLKGYDEKVFESVARDILFWRYGNIKVDNSTKMPFYNMFNGQRIKQFLANKKLAQAFCDANIVDFIKSYTEDTDLGPQDIYYLTELGEKYIMDKILPYGILG